MVRTNKHTNLWIHLLQSHDGRHLNPCLRSAPQELPSSSEFILCGNEYSEGGLDELAASGPSVSQQVGTYLASIESERHGIR